MRHLLDKVRRVLNEGDRQHDSFPDYVLVDEDTWRDAKHLAESLLIQIQQKKSPSELSQWQQFAAYCRCCAQCGEHDPMDFEAFRRNRAAAAKEAI